MPTKTWIEISNSNNRQNVISGFVYPMIGICSFVVFIGIMIRNMFNILMLQEAMTKCCAVAVSLFAGYYLSLFLVNYIGKSYLNRYPQNELTQQFVGYSMVVIFALKILGVIFPFPLLLGFFNLYIIVVVFEGARIFMKVERNRITYYTLMASVILVACPFIIEKVFNKLLM